MSNEVNKIHIGTIIRDQLKKAGMTKSELARRIGTSPQNIFGIFKRETIDTGTLLSISNAMDIDLFSVYQMPSSSNRVYQDHEVQRIEKQNQDLIIQNELLTEMHQLYKEKITELEKKQLSDSETDHLIWIFGRMQIDNNRNRDYMHKFSEIITKITGKQL